MTLLKLNQLIDGPIWIDPEKIIYVENTTVSDQATGRNARIVMEGNNVALVIETPQEIVNLMSDDVRQVTIPKARRP